MSTKAFYPRNEIGPGKVGFAKTRSIIEAAFYGNNVEYVRSVERAYELAKESPGTIITDLPVYDPIPQGLPYKAKILLFNDGSITGRYKDARRIAGEENTNTEKLDKLLFRALPAGVAAVRISALRLIPDLPIRNAEMETVCPALVIVANNMLTNSCPFQIVLWRKCTLFMSMLNSCTQTIEGFSVCHKC